VRINELKADSGDPRVKPYFFSVLDIVIEADWMNSMVCAGFVHIGKESTKIMETGYMSKLRVSSDTVRSSWPLVDLVSVAIINNRVMDLVNINSSKFTTND